MFVGDRWIGFCLDCKTVYDIETGKPAEKEDKEEWIKNHIQEAEVYQLNA